MNTWLRIVISGWILLTTGAFLQLRSYGESVPIHKSLVQFPQTIGVWQGQEDTTLGEDVLAILKLNDYVMRRYRDPTGTNVWLYVGYWDTQRKGAQIHSPKHCLPGGGWEPLEAKQITIPLSSPPGEIEVNRYIVQKDQYQQVVIYWYQSQGRVVAKEIDAKWQLIRNAMLHNRTDGALVRLTSPVTDSVQTTFARQVQYVQALYPLLGEFIPQ
ncbi:MAG: exosortase C-terminal domain/associated protein EpsI [Candidatus Binatia bacterium]